MDSARADVAQPITPKAGEQSTEKVDAFLASELNNMSVEERNFVFEEIHGVAQHAVEELSIQKLNRSLLLLSEALYDIKNKPAYDEAQRIASEEGHSTFVNDRSYRLKFLRAECFDPRKAAERMVRNLDILYRYIGRKGLCRPICIGDLDANAVAIMESGSFQLLPFRDRSGRRIGVRIGPLGLDFISNEQIVSIHGNANMREFIFILRHNLCLTIHFNGALTLNSKLQWLLNR
ncbi:unnamed protein product [Pseudo-nitzschia multistriata]|uniref:CRAL/TRIO N-terminal domain-containing protein n=1 Tax=Pseudo-nitzschia multistriata TaxID=183589 RepID=A0A448ZFV7_9STRA|nr:unnamed protein product [Pseudo-nitzschia multistriata]